MKTKDLQFEILTHEECLSINGGDKFMKDLGRLFGVYYRAIWEYANTTGGGYSYAKCGY